MDDPQHELVVQIADANLMASERNGTTAGLAARGHL
jgi:hypothetical protein